MKLREPIMKALDLLMSESAKNFDEKTKALKMEAWHMALDDVSDEEIYKGIMKGVKATDGFPAACGTFRSLCLTGDGETIESETHKAWALVMKTLNHCISPVFKDIAITESIRRMGGWKQLCNMLTKDEPFLKKDFMVIYQAIRKSNQKDFDPVLIGTFGIKYSAFVGFDKKDQPLLDTMQQELEKGERDRTKLMDMFSGKLQLIKKDETVRLLGA